MKTVVKFMLPIALLLPAVPAAGAECGTREGAWRSVAAPAFEQPTSSVDASAARIQSLSVDPTRPGRWYAASSERLARTDDAGCTWRLLAELPTAAGATGRIATVAAGGVPGRLLVAGHLEVGGAPFVLRSDDAGATLSGPAAGVPAEAGYVRDVVVDGPRVYVLVAPVGSGPGWLLRSDDGARRFTTVSRPPSVGLEVSVAVDPRDRDHLLLPSGDEVLESRDGGRTLTPLRVPVERPVAAALAVGQLRVAGSGKEARSDDGGRTWRLLPVPQEPGQRSPRDVLVTAVGDSREAGLSVVRVAGTDSSQNGGGVVSYDAARRALVRVEPASRPPLWDPELERTAAGPRYVVRARDRVWTYTPASSSRATAPPRGAPAPRTAANEPRPSAALRTAQVVVPTVVEADPGETVAVDARLVVPGRGRPLDLGVLLDATVSTETWSSALATVLPQVVGAVAAAGGDVHAGVALYQDYAVGPPGESGVPVPYARVRALGVPDDALVQALLGVVHRGNRTREESATTGLVQSVAGTGVVPPPGTASSNAVPPGQDLRFREGSLRLLLHLPGTPFDRRLGPSVESAVAVLRAEGVRQLALVLPEVYGSDPASQARRAEDEAVDAATGRTTATDAAEVARGTGAVAARPVDCDGDGTADLAAGEPLVCPLVATEDAALELSRAVLELLASTSDPGRAGLVVDGDVGRALPLRDVDLARPVSVRERLVLTCPETGGEHPVQLRGVVAVRVVARADLVLRCGPSTGSVVDTPTRTATAIVDAPASDTLVGPLLGTVAVTPPGGGGTAGAPGGAGSAVVDVLAAARREPTTAMLLAVSVVTAAVAVVASRRREHAPAAG